MVCSAMAGSGKDFAEGRMRGKLRRIKNESNGRTSPRRKQKNLRIPAPPNFEWQQNAPCLPQRQKLNSVKIFIAF